MDLYFMMTLISTKNIIQLLQKYILERNILINSEQNLDRNYKREIEMDKI